MADEQAVSRHLSLVACDLANMLQEIDKLRTQRDAAYKALGWEIPDA